MRRLTTVESLNFQSDTFPTLVVLTQSERFVESEDQPFQKIQKITTSWVTIKTSLIQEYIGGGLFGIISIRHDKSNNAQVLPTKEEKALADSIVVKVRIGGVVALLLPGESLRMCPESLPVIELCCSHSSARATVTVFPR